MSVIGLPWSLLRAIERRAGDAIFQLRIGLQSCGLYSSENIAAIGRALVARQRFQEADRVLSHGLDRAPNHVGMRVAYALSAHNRGDHVAAAERWASAHAVSQTDPMIWAGIAASARETHRMEAAVATLAEAKRRFPDDPGIMAEAARIADLQGDHAQALTLWQRLIARKRPSPEWLRAHANALILLGRFDEAEAAIGRVLPLYPENRGVIALPGVLAMAREDWDDAIEFWRAFRSRFPEDMTGWELLGRSIEAKRFAQGEAAQRSSMAPADVTRVEDDAIRVMLLGFESLGWDCEFGLLQRRYGAEPLGLLRFNTVRLESLLNGLAARFEGMGEPENTVLTSRPNGEYYVEDARWGFGMHTFLFTSQIEADALFPKMCRRVVFLKDKLLEDLATAQKIFVYKSDEITLADMRKLHAALQVYGAVRLLCVTKANDDAGHAPLCGRAGQVFRIEEGFSIGFIGRMGAIKGVWDIAFDDWISICRGMDAAPLLTRTTT